MVCADVQTISMERSHSAYLAKTRGQIKPEKAKRRFQMKKIEDEKHMLTRRHRVRTRTVNDCWGKRNGVNVGCAPRNCYVGKCSYKRNMLTT